MKILVKDFHTIVLLILKNGKIVKSHNHLPLHHHVKLIKIVMVVSLHSDGEKVRFNY